MKKIIRKNQIIITALAIMIVIAGYLNFTGQEISTSGLVSSRHTEKTKNEDGKKDTAKATAKPENGTGENKAEKKEDAEKEEAAMDISEEDMASADYQVTDQGEIVASEENPGEAVMVSNNLSSDYFSSAKLSREQNRAKNKESLMEIINNKEVASKDKKAAVTEVAEMTKTAEQENAAEMMLEAKGFTDAVVSISDGTADVVVNAGELSSKEMAQIEDIIKRKTDVSAENIVITPVKVDKKK